MEGILKVSPEKLQEASGEFSTTGGQMKTITDEMMSIIDSLKGIWEGEASTSYNVKFHSLQEDMDKLYRMVKEHSEDLNQMATEYIQAENANREMGDGLTAGVVV